MPTCLLSSYKLFSNHSTILPLCPDENAFVPYYVMEDPRLIMMCSILHEFQGEIFELLGSWLENFVPSSVIQQHNKINFNLE
jgi:hypothetical protein